MKHFQKNSEPWPSASIDLKSMLRLDLLALSNKIQKQKYSKKLQTQKQLANCRTYSRWLTVTFCGLVSFKVKHLCPRVMAQRYHALSAVYAPGIVSMKPKHLSTPKGADRWCFECVLNVAHVARVSSSDWNEIMVAGLVFKVELLDASLWLFKECPEPGRICARRAWTAKTCFRPQQNCRSRHEKAGNKKTKEHTSSISTG